jgi:hypothetical protein
LESVRYVQAKACFCGLSLRPQTDAGYVSGSSIAAAALGLFRKGLPIRSSVYFFHAGTIILGVVADKKKDHKRTLSLLLILGLIGEFPKLINENDNSTSAAEVAAGIVAWSLMLQGLVPLPADPVPRIGQLSALSVVVAIGFYSTTPIFFEAAVEASHPLPQGSVIMLMTFIFNAFSIIILAIPAQSR